MAKRGRFGVFAGCSRYPDCTYIHRTGPPPPPPLPFEAACPRCSQGVLVVRRARRTGTVFYGCGRYPACDFTTNFEPLGAIHDADAGAVAARAEAGICLRCGASIDLPIDRTTLVGATLAGGPPDPAALQPSRKRKPSTASRPGGNSTGKSRSTTKSGGTRRASTARRRAS